MGTLASPPSSHAPNQFWRFFIPMHLHVGVIHLVMNIVSDPSIITFTPTHPHPCLYLHPYLYRFSTQVVVGGDVESVYGFWNTCFVYLISGTGIKTPSLGMRVNCLSHEHPHTYAHTQT